MWHKWVMETCWIRYSERRSRDKNILGGESLRNAKYLIMVRCEPYYDWHLHIQIKQLALWANYQSEHPERLTQGDRQVYLEQRITIHLEVWLAAHLLVRMDWAASRNVKNTIAYNFPTWNKSYYEHREIFTAWMYSFMIDKVHVRAQ